MKEQFLRLLRYRLDERNRRMIELFTEEKQRFNARGLLYSSETVKAMHRVLENELKDSADLVIKTAIDIIKKDGVLVDEKKLYIVCSRAFLERKNQIEKLFQSNIHTIKESLLNSEMLEPYMSLKNLYQLKQEELLINLSNAYAEYVSGKTGGKGVDLASRIKNHPGIALLILIFVAIAGVSAFFEDLRVLRNAAACIPFELGLRAYEGTATVVTITREYEWQKIRGESKVKGTGNHHCESNCRGEPTRTNYTITLDLLQSEDGVRRELRNPQLMCVSGPCGAWNDIIGARITRDGLRAVGNFDVWSKPTSWRLSADVYEYRIVKEYEKSEENLDVSTDQVFELDHPEVNAVVRVSGVMEDRTPFEFMVGEDDDSDIFKFLEKKEDATGSRYSYHIRYPKCENS